MVANAYWLEAWRRDQRLMSELVARDAPSAQAALLSALETKVMPSGDVVPAKATLLRIYRNGELLDSKRIERRLAGDAARTEEGG